MELAIASQFKLLKINNEILRAHIPTENINE